MSNILDQVITSQHQSAMAEFNVDEIIAQLFAILNEREKEIIARRHGLFNTEKSTLEEIGKKHKVTRERVRQVENSSLKKIRENYNKEILKAVENLTSAILAEYGGIMAEDRLVTELAQNSGNTEESHAAVRFLLNQLLHDKFQPFKETSNTYKSWGSIDASWEKFLQDLDAVVKLIETHDEPVELNSLIKKVNEKPDISINEADEGYMLNVLDITKNVDKNIYGEYGLSHWPTIKPKRMNDKIYLVLKKNGEPLHFSEIAEAINKAHFDNRIAYPATIHNELILDKKFVLVGRGIYALTEWGYKPGVVADVIEEILKKSDKPLTKDEIIEQVLKNRIVKKSTVVLALMNKDKFVRNADKTYSVKAQ